MKGNRLSDLLFTAPQKVKIKDYAKINEIFKAYLKEHYDYMAKEIYWYKPSEFFTDFSAFLNMHFKQELWKKFFLKDIWELYDEREESVLYESKIKKQKKKWFR